MKNRLAAFFMQKRRCRVWDMHVKKENSEEICPLSGRGRALQHWADEIPGAGERSQSSV